MDDRDRARRVVQRISMRHRCCDCDCNSLALRLGRYVTKEDIDRRRREVLRDRRSLWVRIWGRITGRHVH